MPRKRQEFRIYFVAADQLRQAQEMCEAKGVPLLGHQFELLGVGQLTVSFVPKIKPGARIVAIGFAVGK